MNIAIVLFAISLCFLLITIPVIISYGKWSKAYSKYWSDSVSMIEDLSDQILHH